MKDDEKLLGILNRRLADELADINQYMGKTEMHGNWTYGILKKNFEKQALDELHYASWLIQRIIFLEEIMAVTKLDTISDETGLESIKNNSDAEIKNYYLTTQLLTINR